MRRRKAVAMELLIFLLAGALLSGFVNGLVGFGTGLTALGFWLHVLEPQEAGPLVVVCSLLGGALALLKVRDAIDRPRLALFTLPGLLAVPIGVSLLTWLEPAPLKAALGAFLVCYSLIAFWGPMSRVWMGLPRWFDALVGFASGIMGGLVGLSGVFVTPWTAVRGWQKAQRRALYQPYSMVILTASLVTLILAGAINQQIWIYIALCAPATLLGSWVGLRCYGRLGEALFAKIVLVLLLASGLWLVGHWLVH